MFICNASQYFPSILIAILVFLVFSDFWVAPGLHKLSYFVHKVPYMRNCFRCTPLHVALIIKWYGGGKCTKSVLKPVAVKNGLSFSVVYCCFSVDYTISVYMMTALHSCTLRNLFTYLFFEISVQLLLANSQLQPSKFASTLCICWNVCQRKPLFFLMCFDKSLPRQNCRNNMLIYLVNSCWFLDKLL